MNNRSDPFSGTRAAVLGATGFIGRSVAAALSRRGARVLLVARDLERVTGIAGALGSEVEVAGADAEEPGSVAAAIALLRPSVTFNLIGYGVDRTERDDSRAQRLNTALIPEIVRAMAALKDPDTWTGLDVVHAGSALEYGDVAGRLSETLEPNPTTTYGRTKLEGTRQLALESRRLGIRTVTARLFTVYGTGEHDGRLLPSLLEGSRTGEAIPLTDGRQERDFTYIGDVSEGLLRLATSAVVPGEVVNLATGQLTTVRQFVMMAAKILRIPEERLQFGALPTRAEEMRTDGVDVSRLRQLVSWLPPTTIPDGVRLTAMEKEQQ